MARKQIKDIVAEELADFLAENGYELYNVEFVKEGKDRFLRVYIDKVQDGEEEYVSTDDCEKVSRYLSEKLDETDPIPENYYLEVSSPGLDRVLWREKDFRRFTGREAEIKLYQPLDGRKNLRGILTDCKEGKVVIEENGSKTELTLEQIARARLTVTF